MANKNTTIHIATSSIIKVVLVVLGLWFLYFIRDVIIILFVGIVLAAALYDPVEALVKIKVNRIVAVVLVYLAITAVIATGFYLVLPPFGIQISQFANNVPVYLLRVKNEFWFLRDVNLITFQRLEGMSSYLTDFAGNIVTTTINVFGVLFSIAFIFIISIYISMQEKGLRNFFLSIMPESRRSYAIVMAERIQKKLGSWLRGQIILALIIGSLVTIGLSLLNVPYALTFGIIAAILEFIPYFGPVIASIPAILIAFLQAPLVGFLVLILYVVVQQLENQLIAPLVMHKAVGVNPLVIIFAFLIGAKAAGFLGIVLAVPIAAIINEFARDLIDMKVVK